MSDRAKSLRRVTALQGRLKDVAALNLARAEAAHAAVAAERAALQELLDRSTLTGRLAVLALDRTRALMAQETVADTRRRERGEERRRAETKLKLAERISDAATREAAAVAERRALERLIEEAVGRDEDPA